MKSFSSNYNQGPILPGSGENRKTLDVGALIGALIQHRIRVAVIMIVSTATAIAVSYTIPKTYTANASILPNSSSEIGAGLASSIALQMGAMSGFLGGMAAGRSGDLVEILKSRTITERVITKLELDREITGWKYRSDLVVSVSKMVTIIPPTLKNKVIGIEVQSSNPKRSEAIANAYVEELESMLNELKDKSSTKNRIFIEGQLSRTRASLEAAENRLASFQTSNGLASLPETVAASIRAISDLEAQRVNAQIQMQSTEKTLDAMRDGVATLQVNPNTLHELEIKKKALAAQNSALSKAQSDFAQKLSELPPKGMALARMQRDVQVQNAIYLALSQQYESALISENNESEEFTVLDYAQMPDRPSKPKKSLIALAGLIGGIFLGSGYAVYLWKKECDQAAKTEEPETTSDVGRC